MQTVESLAIYLPRPACYSTGWEGRVRGSVGGFPKEIRTHISIARTSQVFSFISDFLTGPAPGVSRTFHKTPCSKDLKVHKSQKQKIIVFTSSSSKCPCHCLSACWLGLTHQSSYERATLSFSGGLPLLQHVQQPAPPQPCLGSSSFPGFHGLTLRMEGVRIGRQMIICIHGEPMQRNHLFYFIYEHFIY